MGEIAKPLDTVTATVITACRVFFKSGGISLCALLEYSLIDIMYVCICLFACFYIRFYSYDSFIGFQWIFNDYSSIVANMNSKQEGDFQPHAFVVWLQPCPRWLLHVLMLSPHCGWNLFFSHCRDFFFFHLWLQPQRFLKTSSQQ